MTFGPEEPLDLALDVPDPSDVIISTREQVLSRITPLNRLYEVVLVGALRDLVIASVRTDVPQLYQGFGFYYWWALYHPIQ